MLGDMPWAASPTSTADQHDRATAPAFLGHLLDRRDMHPGQVVELLQQSWDRGGEAGETLAQASDRVAVGLVGGVGGYVGVAVDQPAADRNRQERASPAKHDRPGGGLRRAGRQEPPAVLADRDRRPLVDGQPPDRGAQAVGPDDQVELAAVAVVEGNPDRPVEVVQRPDTSTQPHQHAVAEDLVQLGAG
jgi:hypothetical protein